MQKDALVETLLKGDISVDAQFLSGSNYTFLGKLTYR